MKKEPASAEKAFIGDMILDAIPSIVFFKTTDNRMIKVNKAYASAMGMPKSQIEGKSCFEVHPNQPDGYFKDDAEVIRSGRPKRNIVETFETKKGIIILQTDKIPYKDEHNKIIGIIGFSVNISDRVKAEAELTEAHAMLDRIINLLPVRIFWKDMKLRYLGCNEAFAKDAGKASPVEVVGKDDFELGWKKQASRYRADDMRVINSGEAKHNFEEPQTTPSGDTIWLSTSKVPLINQSHEVIGILGLYDDITSKKKAEDEIQRKNAELERFNKVAVDRELRMIELKKRIKELEQRG